MSELPLPLPDPTSMVKSLKDFISYWRTFKGKKIRIYGPSSSSIRHQEDEMEFHTIRDVVEGEVAGVLAYPPGLFLQDVKQYVRHEWNVPHYVAGKKEPEDWYTNINDSPQVQNFDKKFVSFSFINSVEFLGD